MSARRSPLSAGLYFIDVLACLLFCLVLALVGARFGREHSVELDLPELASAPETGASLTGREIALRERDGRVEVWLDGEATSLEELALRLREQTPPSVVVRSETSLLSRVVGIAHEAGVREIELTYEVKRAAVDDGTGGGR